MSSTPAAIAIRVLGISVMTATIVCAATPAGATQPRVCAPVQLSGVGQDLGFGPDGNDHTHATVSLLGVAIGTTNATFTFTGTQVGSSQGFKGPIVFTPRVGSASLTAQVNGSVDVLSGVFTASSTAISGSGTLRAVSGRVSIHGHENLTTGAFTETITGRLCAPLAVRSAT